MAQTVKVKRGQKVVARQVSNTQGAGNWWFKKWMITPGELKRG